MAPTLLPNFFVFINVENKFFRIKASEPFEFRTGEETTAIFSSVASGSESGFKNVTILEPDDIPKHLFEINVGVKFAFKYFIKVPTGTNRFGTDTDKSIGFIDNFMSPFDDPNEDYRMWLVKNFFPSINAVNKSQVANTPKIHFTGFKYELEEVVDRDILARLRNGQIPFSKIIVGGIDITK